MPEEVNRVVADVICDLRFCPSETAVANLAAEGIRDGVHLVGDVMVDVARHFGPIAQRRSDALARMGVEPGAYALITAHRQSNTMRDAMEPLVEVLEAVDEPAGLPAAPAHPRRAGGGRPARPGRGRGHAVPTARLPGLHGAAGVRRASA